ncbi:ammonium transporter AmtB-like domain-containing protein [Chytriomyces sp. MP71]|nr:ammonium transporter AmtB-like domain-containing protein [Chytriomyces sp. MP71]
MLKLTAVLSLVSVALAQNSTTTSESPLVSGDISWILISSALVFIQIPGLVVTMQWVLFGYSLAFSDTSSSNFIGNFQYAALLNTLDVVNPVAGTIPAALFAMYQLMFAAITPGLAIGAVAGRMRLLPMMIFVFLWTTIVYDPIAYWSWSGNGFLHSINVMDYAGGSVVHLSSGVTGLVLALTSGKRSDYGTRSYEIHNPTFVYIGTMLLWFGWNGFNGGSAVSASTRAVGAAFATNIAASAGGLTMMAMEALVNKKRFSAIGFCNGVVVALVAITPGSGYVQPGMAILFGILPAIVCFYAVKVLHYIKVDDVLEASAGHGVGGAFGMILTGLFAQHQVTDIGTTPGSSTAGWVDRVWIQIPVQLAGIGAVLLWTAGWTAIIVFAVNLIPGMKMRCHKEAEAMGLDAYEVGEASYPYIPVVSSETDSILGRSGNSSMVRVSSQEKLPDQGVIEVVSSSKF